MTPVRRRKASISPNVGRVPPMPTSFENDQTDLFYVDEALLSSTDEEECQNLMDCNCDPEEIVDPVFRAKYVKYLEVHGDEGFGAD